jgi:lauroyl/myristoyl acyltransferase
MNLRSIVTDPRFMRLAIFLSQRTPEGVFYRLGWWLTNAACRLSPAPTRIVQANLAQVLGPEVDTATLKRTARRAVFALAQSSYTLYRAVSLRYEQLVASVEFPEATQAVARSLWGADGGSVLVFPHLGNFDLGGLALSAYTPQIQVLSLPDPPAGFQLSNELRRRTGAKVTPLSPAALREAIRHLRAGNVLAVAGDRPVSELDEPVLFFGQPARVPSGHIRLALKTGARVVIAYCVWSPETRRYVFHLEPPLEVVRTGNRDDDVRVNLRRILEGLEAVIRRWPEQWQMFVPVWPDLRAE